MTENRKPRIAFVDDEKGSVASFRARYEGHYDVLGFESPREALKAIDETVAVTIADFKMPEMNGIEFLTNLRNKTPETYRVLITAFAELGCRPDAINNAGIFKYIQKTDASHAEMRTAIEQAVALYSLHRENDRKVKTLERKNSQLEALIRKRTSHVRSFDDLLGSDPEFLRAVALGKLVADNDITVLITGESGTGKGELARAIHFSGNRRDYPFVYLNCAELSLALTRSDLFGTTKGGYTGAIDAKGKLRDAEGGTVFFDEIGDLPLDVQPIFFSFLDGGGGIRPVGPSAAEHPRPNVRFIFATNQDLSSAARQGTFRPELLRRIDDLRIHVPALRERKADIPSLARHLVIDAANSWRLDSIPIDDSAVIYLQSLPYPGNIGEMANIIRKAVAEMMITGARTLGLEHVRAASRVPSGTASARKVLSLEDATVEFQKQYIEAELERHNWDLKRTAALLGVEERTFRNIRNALKISRAV
jgi:two-component system response regulator HupR/HoxA